MEHTMNGRAIVLTRDTYYQLLHDLWRALPPPVSGRPEDLVRRDNAAMASVASLLPADPEEAALASQFVAACAHAMDCLRLVNEHAAEPMIAMKCRAQAISMMRQACCARSMLMRIQEARRKGAARGIEPDEPVWSDHGILDRATEALNQAPAPAPKAEAPVQRMTEQAVSHPAAALDRTDAPAGGLPATQTVASTETKSQNHATETPARLDRPAAPVGVPPDSLPGPRAASRPPQHPNERSEARVPASSAPSKRDLPTFDPVTGVMRQTPHPAGTIPRAIAA